MALNTGPNSATLGLIFAYDVGDIINSYKGEPTTNTLPSPGLNAFPTIGNGWATYNTNRYCDPNPPYTCGTYWPIPAIASVSGNVITTVSTNPMRSFDVLRPQTTGGGLVADTDYLVKKISDTQFTLHAYNSSQDGSQGYKNPATGGYKVHDSYWLDERIAVNASGFPTMWWGYPHLPNSGLVKELIFGGFDLYTDKTDCIRLHGYRTDGVVDGMAYGPDAVVVPGQVFTYSFWSRATNPVTAGAPNNLSFYNYGTIAPISFGYSWTHGPLYVWQKNSFQFTPVNQNLISYYFPGSFQDYDIANIQVEQKNHATQFVPGTRSTTAGLLTLSGNNTVFLDNASFNGNAEIALDGSNDFIKVSQTGSFYTNQFTWEIITKFTANTGTYQGLVWAEGSTGGGSGLQYLLTLYNHSYLHYRVSNSITGWTNTDTASITFDPTKYNHIVWQFNNGETNIYINGILFHNDHSRGFYNGGTDSAMFLGARNDGSYSSAMMPAVYRCYNRLLLPTEIQENYKGYKTRFNLG